MPRRGALAATAAAVAAWPFVEPHLPVLRRREAPVLPTGAQPLVVLHLSDLHLLPRHRRRADWLRGLAAHRPDLVVSTGDHVSSAAATPLLAAALGSFDVPAFFVPGNNDYYTPVVPRPWHYLAGGSVQRRRPDAPWDDVAAALTARGWTDVTTERAEVEVRGTRLVVTGVDDAHLRRDRYRPAPVPTGAVGIGLTHTPARRVLDAMSRDGHALLLAGHTHGGQLRLPGLGALVTNCDLERSRARGVTPYGTSWLHVSAGLGTSPYAPVRTLCRPEAVLLSLVPRAASGLR